MASKAALIKKLVKSLGGSFSKELGIELSGGSSGEIFKWFLASKLFGARISAAAAIKTYREFERRGVTTPGGILNAGWDGLVKILDDGGYARYDFSTASRLLEIMETLETRYKGDLNRLYDEAEDGEDIESRLKALGKGIGDVTVNIFLRELREIWPKADPVVSDLIQLAAVNLGIMRPGTDALEALNGFWSGAKVRGCDFSDFEAALLRLGKDYCKKSRYLECPMKMECRRKESCEKGVY